MERFREFNLKLKPSKCSFFQSEIVYLAHHVLKEGIHPSNENIRAILEFPMPETYTEIRAFCGLSGHYRRFIRNFAHIAQALYNLLGNEVKMGPVTLTPEAEEAVRILKEKIMSAPVLVFPDFNNPSCWNRCIQRRIGSGAVTKAGRWTLPSCGIWQQDIDTIRAELP